MLFPFQLISHCVAFNYRLTWYVSNLKNPIHYRENNAWDIQPVLWNCNSKSENYLLEKFPRTDKAHASVSDNFGWDISHHFQVFQLVVLIYGRSLRNAIGWIGQC